MLLRWPCLDSLQISDHYGVRCVQILAHRFVVMQQLEDFKTPYLFGGLVLEYGLVLRVGSFYARSGVTRQC